MVHATVEHVWVQVLPFECNGQQNHKVSQDIIIQRPSKLGSTWGQVDGLWIIIYMFWQRLVPEFTLLAAQETTEVAEKPGRFSAQQQTLACRLHIYSDAPVSVCLRTLRTPRLILEMQKLVYNLTSIPQRGSWYEPHYNTRIRRVSGPNWRPRLTTSALYI